MIQRVVLCKFHEAYSNPEARAEAAAHSRVVLPTMAGVVSATAGTPADERAEAWDLCITVTLDSMEAVTALKRCPIHVVYGREFLNPRLAAHEAFNFQI